MWIYVNKGFLNLNLIMNSKMLWHWKIYIATATPNMYRLDRVAQYTLHFLYLLHHRHMHHNTPDSIEYQQVAVRTPRRVSKQLKFRITDSLLGTHVPTPWIRSISSIPQCIIPIPYNAPLCDTCAHFSYKVVHCGLFVWCTVEFVSWI